MTDLHTLMETLAWQEAMGVDLALDEHAGLLRWPTSPATTPTSRPPDLGQKTLDKGLPSPPSTPSSPPSLTAPFSCAQTLKELENDVLRFEGCALKQTAMNTIFSGGSPQAPLMIVGEAPGEDDDRQGQIFSGAAGRLLESMLAAINLSRADVYLTNLVFWRPPGNRAPSEVEIEACLPLTERHIALAAPRWLILMGAAPTRALLRTKEPFSRLRGRWTTYTLPSLETAPPPSFRCLPLHPPSYLLRQPESKRQAWADLLRLAQEMNDSI